MGGKGNNSMRRDQPCQGKVYILESEGKEYFGERNISEAEIMVEGKECV